MVKEKGREGLGQQELAGEAGSWRCEQGSHGVPGREREAGVRGAEEGAGSHSAWATPALARRSPALGPAGAGLMAGVGKRTALPVGPSLSQDRIQPRQGFPFLSSTVSAGHLSVQASVHLSIWASCTDISAAVLGSLLPPTPPPWPMSRTRSTGRWALTL